MLIIATQHLIQAPQLSWSLHPFTRIGIVNSYSNILLFKSLHDTLRSIQKYETWIRISALLLAHTVLGVLLAIFCPLSPQGKPLRGGLVLVILLLVARVGAVNAEITCQEDFCRVIKYRLLSVLISNESVIFRTLCLLV